MASLRQPSRPAPAGRTDNPPPTTVLPLTKPVYTEPGYDHVAVVIPLRTDLEPATLSKVTWALLLARFAGAEQAVFGHSQALKSPFDLETMTLGLNVCALHLGPEVKLASAFGKSYLAPDHPSSHREWILSNDYQGKLATVLVVGDCQPHVDKNKPSAQTEQEALNALGAMTQATLVVSCQGDTRSLAIRITFSRSRVVRTAVQELAHQFCIVARALVDAAEDSKQFASMTIADVAWVNESEHQRLLRFAGTISHPDAVNTPTHLLVSEWAARTPGGIALDHAGRTVTYAELDRLTSALAQPLVRNYGARPEIRIALLLPKSIEFVIALFAVLKSGAAYVPIDPEYPEERIRYIIEDSRATLVLAGYESQGRLGNITCPKLLVSNVAVTMSSTEDNACPFVAHHSEPTDLAYIVYTSGTTGQPKGVMVEHGSLASFTVDPTFNDFYGPGQRDLLVLSIGFDGILWSAMKTLCNGGTLVLPGLDLLGDLAGVHTASVTPSFLAKLRPEQFPLLRGIICGGEPCNQRLVNSWSSHCGLVNGYGPTETTVISLTSVLCIDDMITVGRPLHNVLAYIVDDDLHLVPVGAPGQLLIGGLGVARGYCNQPELTAQRFIANPFGPGRVYLTGDRARWLSNGHVDLLGRMDHQVKLRGYRIELEEVEATAISFSTVQLAVASVRNDRLVLFVEPHSVDTSALLDHLRSRLANFMVPDHVAPVTQLPLTTNGKVDRSALSDLAAPVPEASPVDSSDFTEFELRLREAWAQVLSLPVERIGATNDFFRVGGDSISAILLVSKCQQLGFRVTVPLIYECRQLRALAARLTPLATAAAEANQRQVKGPVELTPIQHWFLGLPFRYPHHFNQSFTLRVCTSVTPDQVNRALVQLANHHDILRARFHINDQGAWTQYIPSSEAIPDHVSLTEATVAESDYADRILKVQA
ncbi:hypothetical protein IWQ60_011298, partial [Tieghemiomyces parasiticus]